jgi:hypothetical protein
MRGRRLRHRHVRARLTQSPPPEPAPEPRPEYTRGFATRPPEASARPDSTRPVVPSRSALDANPPRPTHRDRIPENSLNGARRRLVLTRHPLFRRAEGQRQPRRCPAIAFAQKRTGHRQAVSFRNQPRSRQMDYLSSTAAGRDNRGRTSLTCMAPKPSSPPMTMASGSTASGCSLSTNTNSEPPAPSSGRP